jgi:hypothetical protein
MWLGDEEQSFVKQTGSGNWGEVSVYICMICNVSPWCILHVDAWHIQDFYKALPFPPEEFVGITYCNLSLYKDMKVILCLLYNLSSSVLCLLIQ